MIKVPDSFARSAERRFGEAGREWVSALPEILARCESRWRLTSCTPIADLSINLVYYATSRSHGDVVLKVLGPHSERDTEMYALEHYGGRRACRCLADDHKLGVMLLERLRPGEQLRVLHDKDKRLAVGIELVDDLPCPVTDNHPFPTYREWLDRTFARAQNHFTPLPEEPPLYDAAIDLYERISDGPVRLLHGDLHHDNILSCADGWKAIDPQGVVGPMVMECGRFIQNHDGGDEGLDIGAALRTAERMAGALLKPTHDVVAALFILHLLSGCWCREMSDPPETVARVVSESSRLLQVIRRGV